MTDKIPASASPLLPVEYDAAERSKKARIACTDDLKSEIVDRLSSGQTLMAIARLPHMPPYDLIWKARKSDPDFDRALTDARIAGMGALVEEAIEHQGAVRLDKGLSIAAAKYSDVIMKAAALLAPKAYGPMMRHAGADGEALTVQVVSYAEQPAKPLIDTTAETLPTDGNKP